MGPSWPSASECRCTVGFCVFGEIVGSPCAVTARREPSLPSSSECSFSVFCVWVRKGPSLRFLSVSFFFSAVRVRTGPSFPFSSEYYGTGCLLGQKRAVVAVSIRIWFYCLPSRSARGCLRHLLQNVVLPWPVNVRRMPFWSSWPDWRFTMLEGSRLCRLHPNTMVPAAFWGRLRRLLQCGLTVGHQFQKD